MWNAFTLVFIVIIIIVLLWFDLWLIIILAFTLFDEGNEVTCILFECVQSFLEVSCLSLYISVHVLYCLNFNGFILTVVNKWFFRVEQLAYLSELLDGALKSHLDRSRRVPHIVNDHVQKSLGFHVISFELLNLLVAKLVHLGAEYFGVLAVNVQSLIEPVLEFCAERFRAFDVLRT